MIADNKGIQSESGCDVGLAGLYPQGFCARSHYKAEIFDKASIEFKADGERLESLLEGKSWQDVLDIANAELASSEAKLASVEESFDSDQLNENFLEQSEKLIANTRGLQSAIN